MGDRNDLTIYDDAADAWWSDDRRWVRTLRKMVPGRLAWFDRHIDWAGKTTLDLGCAGGFMAEALDERGAEVIGLDPAKRAIAAGRRHAQETGRDIRYDVGVGEEMPYADASFDAVVAVDVLEHVRDLDATLSETARVLRPGGMFLFDTINRNALARFVVITMAEDILRLLPKGTHDPAMFVTPEELRTALGRAGLTPGPFAGLGPRSVDRQLDPRVGRIPTQLVQYMGVATRPAG